MTVAYSLDEQLYTDVHIDIRNHIWNNVRVCVYSRVRNPSLRQVHQQVCREIAQQLREDLL